MQVFSWIRASSGGSRRLVALGLLWSTAIGAATQCEPIQRHPAWYSYTDPASAGRLADNITYHCDRNVLRLTGSARTNNPRALMTDIHWTLTRVPNHYLCLAAVARYHARPGYPFYPEESQYPKAECYLREAIAEWPKDSRLRLILGYYLYRKGRLQEARVEYEQALAINPKSVEAQYNLGLVSFDLKDHDKALEYAQAAYAGGYRLPGLRNKLARAGLWTAKSQ